MAVSAVSHYFRGWPRASLTTSVARTPHLQPPSANGLVQLSWRCAGYSPSCCEHNGRALPGGQRSIGDRRAFVSLWLYHQKRGSQPLRDTNHLGTIGAASIPAPVEERHVQRTRGWFMQTGLLETLRWFCRDTGGSHAGALAVCDLERIHATGVNRCQLRIAAGWGGKGPN